MANSVLDSRWAETTRQLALGVEPVDALRGVRVGHRLHVTLEAPPPGVRALRLARHDSGLFVLLQGSGAAVDLVLRIFDRDAAAQTAQTAQTAVYDPQSNLRRVVPRRLRVPLPSAADADTLELTRSARRPALLPGANYDATSAAGLRGRVLRAGVPERWARIEARRAGSALTVGRAHGDDRGEFLLLLDAAAAPMSVLDAALSVELHVWLPQPPLPMPSAAAQAADALWDLPVETLSLTGTPPDAVADARFPLPAGWTAVAAPTVVSVAHGAIDPALVVLNV